MSINELKERRQALRKDYVKACIDLQAAIQPLRERLAAFGFVVWFGATDYVLSTDPKDEVGDLFPLHDAHLAHLMAMSDDQLRTYCETWRYMSDETTTT